VTARLNNILEENRQREIGHIVNFTVRGNF